MRRSDFGMAVLAVLAAGLAAGLAACGGASSGSQTQNSVGRLENVADQSSPAAAGVLRDEAERLEGQNIQLAPDDPNSPVQAAINKAANVQSATDNPRPSAGAMPRAPGDPVPPPKAAPPR